MKHSSSLPLTTDQWVSWNNSDNARFAGTSFLSFLFLADLYAMTTLHCTLPVFPLYILANFCFSLKLPGQDYWEESITVPSYREKKPSTEPFYVIKWTEPLVIKEENQHLPEDPAEGQRSPECMAQWHSQAELPGRCRWRISVPTWCYSSLPCASCSRCHSCNPIPSALLIILFSSWAWQNTYFQLWSLTN